jgi:hypothetical protein
MPRARRLPRRRRSSANTIPTTGGSSTTRKRSGPRPWMCAGKRPPVAVSTSNPSPPLALPINAKPPLSGIAARANRSTAQSSGRTGALPGIAKHFAPRATKIWLRAKQACSSIPIFPRPRLPGFSIMSMARAPRRSEVISPSAPSTAFCCGVSAADACTQPTPPMRRERCCSTSIPKAGMTNC